VAGCIYGFVVPAGVPFTAPPPPPIHTPAVVKVLKLLPAGAMRLQLPRTLQKVANLLRTRMQSTR
jgi:hypothetical protein